MSFKYRILYIVIACMAGGFIFFFITVKHLSALGPYDRKDATGVRKYPDKSVVHLYFADKESLFLKAENRILSHPQEPAQFGKIIINALIKGPREGFMRTIPEHTILRALYITQDGTAYVDLTKTITDEHPGGIESELFTIYSIVNSLILNVSEINTVKILIQGRESETLAGHIDLLSPFKANMLLIR